MRRRVAKKRTRIQKPRVSAVKKNKIALLWEILFLALILTAIAAIGYYGWR